MGDSPEASRLRLESLTGLRFFAALLVVLYHSLTTAHLARIPVLSALSSLGGVGVSFFFVLSGFVLTWSYKPGLARRRFYWHRFARVYPLHLLMTLVAIPLVVLGAVGWSWAVLFAALGLVQAWVPSQRYEFGMNGPSWSLSCEAFFYALLPFLAPVARGLTNRTLGRLLALLLALLVTLTALVNVLWPLQSGVALYTNPLVRVAEFAIGVGLAQAVRNGWRPPLSLPTALAVALAAYVAVSTVNADLGHHSGLFAHVPYHSLPADVAGLVTLPAFALLIAAAAASDLEGRPSLLRSGLLVRLGHWSFALYLSHLLVIRFLVLVVPADLSLLGGLAIELGTLLACVALSGLLFTFVERPAEAYLRPRARSEPPIDGRLAAVRPTSAQTQPASV